MTIRKAKEIALSVVNAVPRTKIRSILIEDIEELAWQFLSIAEAEERVHTIENLEKKVARLEAEIEAAHRLTPFEANTKEGDYLVRATQRDTGDTVFVSGHYSGPIDGGKGVWTNPTVDIFSWDDDHDVSTATHYMPLPAPPDESEAGS